MHDETVSTPTPRWAWRMGVATTALAGALLIAMTVPHASADSSYQPALDQLLDVMQQAANYDAALPVATPDRDAMLLTGLPNTNYEVLSAGLARVTELF